jgi:hypothetical protein
MAVMEMMMVVTGMHVSRVDRPHVMFHMVCHGRVSHRVPHVRAAHAHMRHAHAAHRHMAASGSCRSRGKTDRYNATRASGGYFRDCIHLPYSFLVRVERNLLPRRKGRLRATRTFPLPEASRKKVRSG